MHWYYYVSYFWGGVFFANSFPHIGNGVSGRPFQSPFAKPPGQGLSSSRTNVLWGFANVVIAYLLICHVGSFDLHNWGHALAVGLGMLAISLNAAYGFGRFHGGLLN